MKIKILFFAMAIISAFAQIKEPADVKGTLIPYNCILMDFNNKTMQIPIVNNKDELIQAVIRMNPNYAFLPLATIAYTGIERGGAHSTIVEEYIDIVDSYKSYDLIKLGFIRSLPMDVVIYNYFTNQDSSTLNKFADLEIVKLFSLIQEILK